MQDCLVFKEKKIIFMHKMNALFKHCDKSLT